MNKFFNFLIILIITAAVTISPWSFGSVDIAHKYFIHLYALSALFIWLLKKSIFDKEVQYFQPYFPLLCLVILSFVSMLFSIYRYASLLDTLNLLGYSAIYFTTTQAISTEKRRSFFLWSVILVGTFYASYGIFQYYGFLPHNFWAQQNSLASRFVNSGSYGAFITMPIFITLGLLIASKNAIQKLLLTAIFIVSLISLILSNSRLSWISFIITILLFGTLSFCYAPRIRKQILVFTLLVGLVLMILFLFKTTIWQRILIAGSTQFQSVGQRAAVWIGTLKIIVTHPFGTGAGTFQYIYPSYRIHSDRFFVDYAHSDILQFASELGIIGLGLFGWFLMRVFKGTILELSRLKGSENFVMVGVLCALFSCLLEICFDFSLHIPACAVLFFAVAALLTSFLPVDKSKKIIMNLASFSSALILIAASCLFYSSIYISKKYADIAEKKLAELRLQDALTNCDKSIRSMPLYAQNYADKGSIYSLKGLLTFDANKSTLHKEAEKNFLRAIKLNLYDSNYHLNLALLYANEMRQREAQTQFRLAIKRNPTNGEYYYPYADYCLEQGLLNEALTTYKKSLALFINDDGRFAKLYGSVEGLFEKVYAFTKDYSKLKEMVPVKKLDVRLAFADFLERKNMRDEARAEYEGILKQFPENEYAKQSINRLRGR